jgi:hypothetical protein
MDRREKFGVRPEFFLLPDLYLFNNGSRYFITVAVTNR